MSNFGIMKDTDKIEALVLRVAELLEAVAEKECENARLVERIRAMEEGNRRMMEEERKVQEKWWRDALEDLRKSYTAQMDDLRKTYTTQMEEMRAAHREETEKLLEQIKSLTAMLKNGRRKTYGSQSERILGLRPMDQDEHRDEDENNYDGTPESVDHSGSREKESSAGGPKNDAELIAKIQREMKRRHPCAEIKVVREDYSKAESYTGKAIYHRLEDYFQLSVGERFVKRNGEIEKSLVRVIVRYPETIEEHIYESATVISMESEDYHTSERIEKETAAPGCMFDASSIAWILDEKYGRNKPYHQILEQLNELGFKISESTLGVNAHKAIEWAWSKMRETWSRMVADSHYLMIDETCGLVGCEEGGVKKYKKKYFWMLRSNTRKMVWFVYEDGSRGAKVM